ncbi:THUMP domain-containing protein [Thermoproteus tenax]|uniref:Predicted RNA-binding protein, THUMP domain n=1 Tax=Thermoproteus tenax (strain ATCC 35583 / DSM 2078 / JCM 9277 / NBRC 100435 / Kra 1) TaxID=768679 RepID=G4RP13_THETK|nr:THUMP domain-containing protein [Thermoproteus tenax]CCC81307.1 predicted RNA-binding protein, THUMP domain [Thermoproteus tenax Kra 1]
MSFNLVVATGWRQERMCMEELYKVGDILGKRVVEVWFTGFDGLITGRVDGDPIEFVRGLAELVTSGYYVPKYILRATPIMIVVKTDLDEINRAAAELAAKYIGPNESFKIELKKRGVKYDRLAVIDYVAKAIDRRVDLTRPDKYLWIEMFPTRTGLSVLKEGESFSLMRMKVGEGHGGGEQSS